MRIGRELAIKLAIGTALAAQLSCVVKDAHDAIKMNIGRTTDEPLCDLRWPGRCGGMEWSMLEGGRLGSSSVRCVWGKTWIL